MHSSNTMKTKTLGNFLNKYILKVHLPVWVASESTFSAVGLCSDAVMAKVPGVPSSAWALFPKILHNWSNIA